MPDSLFDQLPEEPLKYIGKFLFFNDKKYLPIINKRLNYLFKDEIKIDAAITLSKTIEVLIHIDKHEKDELKIKLINSPDLLIKNCSYTDISKRFFKNITPFKYALWRLDVSIWQVMLDCLPVTEAGALLKTHLLNQYEELKNKKLTYQLNGKQYMETYVSLNFLLREEEPDDEYELIKNKFWWNRTLDEEVDCVEHGHEVADDYNLRKRKFDQLYSVLKNSGLNHSIDHISRQPMCHIL